MPKGTPGRQVCSIDGCERLVKGFGLCEPHYRKWKKANPLVGPPTDEERFWSKVDRSGECWLWTAGLCHGYGRFTLDGAHHPAHRVAYEWLIGPIPPGLELDHLCRTPACVRPDHLEPVTHAENTRRHFAYQTHCKHGHEFTDENTYLPPNGQRVCRTCVRESNRRSRARAARATG